MCLGVGLFASILCGTVCASWTYMSISFIKLEKSSSIIFSNRFLISCSISSPSGTPMMAMLELLKFSKRRLYYPHFLDSFCCCCSDWLIFTSLCSKSLIWLWLHPLHWCFPVNCSFFKLVYPSFLKDFFKDFIYILDRGEGREKERERSISVWLSLTHLACNPGMCSDW